MAIARDFKPSAIPNPATTNGGGPDPRRSLRLLLGLLGAAPGADAEGPVEEHPVGDGLRHEGDEEPHHRVHPVRRAPRLVPDAADGGAGVRLRRRRQEGGLPDGRQLRRHLNGHLTRENSTSLRKESPCKLQCFRGTDSRLGYGWLLVLICYERKVLLTAVGWFGAKEKQLQRTRVSSYNGKVVGNALKSC